MARPGSASRWATATAPFRPTEKQALQDVLNAPGPAVVADLNGDGIPDIGLMEAGTLGIFLGNGDGTFATPFYIGAGPNPGGILAENLHRAARFGGAAGPGGAGHFGRGHGADQHQQISHV